jgi:hypothetical protein
MNVIGMQRIRPLFIRGMMIAYFVGLSRPASAQTATDVSAQNAAIAQTLYDDAMQLMAEKKYAEACPKLAESNRLDTGMGTRFNLGDCYENLGQLASAWALFTDVADEAKRTKQPGRESVARQRATQLDVRLPKLTLQVPASVANVSGVEVRDGDHVVKRLLWGQPLPVDPGKHTIAVSAPGRRTWKTIVVLQEGAAETVVIGELASTSSARNVGAISLGSVGVAGIVVGSVFGMQARSKWRDDVVLKSCDGGVITQCDLDDANARLEKSGARTDATISTVTFVVGGVALASAALLALWPRDRHSEGPAKSVQVQFVPMVAGGGFFAMGVF